MLQKGVLNCKTTMERGFISIYCYNANLFSNNKLLCCRGGEGGGARLHNTAAILTGHAQDTVIFRAEQNMSHYFATFPAQSQRNLLAVVHSVAVIPCCQLRQRRRASQDGGVLQ